MAYAIDSGANMATSVYGHSDIMTEMVWYWVGDIMQCQVHLNKT